MPPAKKSWASSEMRFPERQCQCADGIRPRDKGLRVYSKATSQQAKDAAESAAQSVFAGLIIEPAVGK